jgi:hypothetical protein
MTNPLIAKYEEIYGKKEEPKPEYVKPSQEQTDTLNKYLENLNFPRVPPQSVATSNTGIAAANPFPKLISYEPTEDAFLDVAGKVQRGDAKVVSMHMNMEHYKKSITFEVVIDN